MHDYHSRRWLAATLIASLCIAKPALSGSNGASQARDVERKNAYIAAINRPDKPATKTNGGTMRDLAVNKLSGLDTNLLDDQVFDLFTALMEKDENAWVRLEAVATIVKIPIPQGKLPKVTGLLEKYRNDERINFQVLASQSLVRLGRKHGRPSLAAERTLAKIAQGTGMANWTVMIPAHNAGTMVMDHGSKAQIPFEEYSKTELRLKAIHALANANSDFSKKVISDLTQDSNELVREAARAIVSGTVGAQEGKWVPSHFEWVTAKSKYFLGLWNRSNYSV